MLLHKAVKVFISKVINRAALICPGDLWHRGLWRLWTARPKTGRAQSRSGMGSPDQVPLTLTPHRKRSTSSFCSYVRPDPARYIIPLRPCIYSVETLWSTAIHVYGCQNTCFLAGIQRLCWPLSLSANDNSKTQPLVGTAVVFSTSRPRPGVACT